MEIKVLQSGLSTSIQDMGRIGWASCGVPESGVMDRRTAGMTNLLLGNDEDAALLEMTMTGVKLRFSGRHVIALGGIGVTALLNEQGIDCFTPVQVEENDMLVVQRIEKGNFAYLAINDGFQCDKILSGRSMYQGITPAGKLKDGDLLSALPFPEQLLRNNADIAFQIERYNRERLEVLPGPEFGLLSTENKQQLAAEGFTVTSDSNRMAFLLEERLDPRDWSMLTSPVVPGTVQLTSGGHLIILMRDAQVTGGYPRILQIAEPSLDILSQKRPGQQVHFHLKTTF